MHIWAYSYQTSLACIYRPSHDSWRFCMHDLHPRAQRSSVTADSQTTDIYDPQFPAYI
ncbi:hypothetical protein BDR06DRAFT_964355 [Suillus hirtellus]|nr:hypothetical protein BDR06DRAFT_964355 [Suillus hirtellus]